MQNNAGDDYNIASLPRERKRGREEEERTYLYSTTAEVVELPTRVDEDSGDARGFLQSSLSEGKENAKLWRYSLLSLSLSASSHGG